MVFREVSVLKRDEIPLESLEQHQSEEQRKEINIKRRKMFPRFPFLPHAAATAERRLCSRKMFAFYLV